MMRGHSVASIDVSCAKASARRPIRIQHSFRESVQADARRDELKRSLLAPVYNAIYGSKTDCPELVMLAKNVERGTNRAIDTVDTLSLAAPRLHRPLSEALLFSNTLSATIRAQYPAQFPAMEIEDLNDLETELQGSFDLIQNKIWRKDYSAKTLREGLEQLYKLRDAINRYIEWIERRLYGGKPQ